MAFGDNFFNKIDRDLGLKERPTDEPSQAEKNYAKLKQKLAQQDEGKRLAYEQEQEKEKEKLEKTVFERKGKELIFHENSLNELFEEAKRRVGSTDIDVEAFSTVYSKEEVGADVAEIQRLDDIFSNESDTATKNKKMATVLEAILADGIARYNWFGESVKIHPPSKYDDYKGGVDGILEIDKNEEGNEYAALGIDATFGSLDSVFKNKVIKNLDKIKNGYLTRVKYFLTDDEKPISKFYIPKIILATEIEMLAELSFLWKHRKNEEYKERLKKNKIKYDIFNQIRSQCEAYADFAREHNQPFIEEAYRNIITTLSEVAEQSKELKMLVSDISETKQSKQLKEIIKAYTAQE